MNFFCKNRSHNNQKKNITNITLQNQDSINHANGRRLFGVYCLTCHTYSNNQALLGNTKNISLDKFFNYVLKDSVSTSASKEKNTHIKFDTLTKKDVSDIKFYLDKG